MRKWLAVLVTIVLGVASREATLAQGEDPDLVPEIRDLTVVECNDVYVPDVIREGDVEEKCVDLSLIHI